MKEPLVTFETAKLAKKKGFDINTYFYYILYEKTKGINGLLKPGSIRCNTAEVDMLIIRENNYAFVPTQSLLQKWLREKHEIIVSVIFDLDSYEYFIDKGINTGSFTSSEEFYDNYEECLEIALQEALELITKP